MPDMRGHLIGFIRAVQERIPADSEGRPLFHLGEPELCRLEFGYGYFDVSKVVVRTPGKKYMLADRVGVEEAVDRFIKAYGLEGGSTELLKARRDVR